MFEYLTAQEAANKWNISARRVQRLCKEERIDGVITVSYTHLDVYKRQPLISKHRFSISSRCLYI